MNLHPYEELFKQKIFWIRFLLMITNKIFNEHIEAICETPNRKFHAASRILFRCLTEDQEKPIRVLSFIKSKFY